MTLASGAYHSGAVTLSDGSAQFNIPAGALPGEPPGYASPDVLIADYLPDAASSATYNSSSGTASVYVVATFITVTPTSTSLTWAQSQSQALAVAMVATGGSGNPTPTGTVALTTGKFSSAATALSAGSATISIPPATLTTGFNILNVSYSGDSNYAALPIAGSALVTVGVVTVSVVPSASTINSTQSLTVTITVNPGSGSPTPTGMVTLVSGSYISTTTPLVNGSATINIPAGSLLPGVDILEVSYGHGNYSGASGQASVTVSGTSPRFHGHRHAGYGDPGPNRDIYDYGDPVWRVHGQCSAHGRSHLQPRWRTARAHPELRWDQPCEHYRRRRWDGYSHHRHHARQLRSG